MSSVGLIANRNSSTDRYAHCHNKSSPDSVSFSDTESKIVSILAKNQISSTLINGDLSGNLTQYNISTVSDIDANEILPVCYPPELIEQDAILASVFKNNDVSFNSVSTNLSSRPSSNNNEVLLSVDNTTTSIYDTVAKFETTIESNLTSTDNTVEAIFDVMDSSAATQYAVNSQYNTKLGIFDMSGADVYPTYVQEHTNYNFDKSCGKNYTQYVSGLDVSSGEPIWSDYDVNVTPLTEKFVLSNIDVSSNDFDADTDFGIFKVAIVLNDKPIITTLSSGSSLNPEDLNDIPLIETYTPNNPVIGDTYIKQLPLFHETNSLSLSNQTKQINDSSLNDTSKFLLPSRNLTINELGTFAQDPANVCVPNFSFKIEVDTSSNSGYKFEDVSYNLASIDDAELKDSLIYMRDWVNHPHSLTFSSGHLSLDVSTNGVQALIDNNEIVFGGNREKLSLTEADNDGIIVINSNHIQDRADVTASLDASNMLINIYYDRDTIPGGLLKIDNELCIEPNISFGWQKIMEKTSKSVTHFKKHSDTTLNLFSNNTLVNDNYYADESKFDYVFNNTNLIDLSLTNPNHNVEIWKIKSGLNLLSQPNKVVDSSGNFINNIQASVQLTNATPAFNSTVRELRQYISTKTNSDLEINSVLTLNGWSSSLDQNGSFLLCSSDTAYSSSNRLPSYTDELHLEFLKNTNTNILTYKIEYSSVPFATNAIALVDTCKISYNYNDSSLNLTYDATDFFIQETDMSFNYTNTPQTTTEVMVDLSEYYYTSSTLNKDMHRLFRVDVYKSSYTSTFNLPFGPYINLNIETPLIQPVISFYTLKSKDASGNFTVQMSPSTLLTRVAKVGLPSTYRYYAQSYRTVYTVDPSDNLTITSDLWRDDLKEFLVYTQSKNMSTDEWTNISDGVSGSIFYSIADEPVINDINDNLLGGTNNIETTLSYSNFVDGVFSQSEIYINSPYYIVPLVMDYRSTEFRLETFTTGIDNYSLISNTNLTTTQSDTSSNIVTKVLNNSYLYSNIKQWNTSNTDYKIISSINDNDITIKVVRTDNDELDLITITINDNYIFVGDFVITNINNDVIRKTQLIGSTYTETFATLADNSTSFNIVDGIYINKVVNQNVPLGSYQLFDVKKDNLAYNLVGNAFETIQPINSLGPYQWTYDSSYNSDTFSLIKYRGHGHSSTTSSSSINQHYTINRPAINATFAITDASNSTTLSQTFNNIYSGALLTLNQLKRNINDVYPSDIGLKILFNFSMPNVTESRNKLIDVVGDSVTIKLLNPASVHENSYLNQNNFPINKTLKDYSLFTFDGSSAYRYNDGPMRIRSSRVKLISNNVDNIFDDNSMVYDLTWVYNEDEVIMKTYKADLSSNDTNVLNYLGNPEYVESVQGSTWRLMNEYTLSQSQQIGTNIGVHNIKFRNDVNVVNTTCYYVSTHPYYRYETMGMGNNITLPYDYLSGDFSNNIVVKYVPNIASLRDANDYVAPFTNTTYRDVIDNPHYVYVDTQNNLVNNMKLKIKPENVRTQKDLCYTPISDKRYIELFGSKIKIDLYKNNQLIRNVYDDYITSLVNDLSNNITLVPSQIDSGIKFMIRQPISVIGYSELETNSEHEDFYNTTDKARWFPLKFTLSNVNIFKSTILELEMLAGPGSYPILYTVKDVISTVDPEKLYRRVYKYEETNAMDFDSVALKTKLTFSSRKYIDIEVPLMTNGTGFNRNKYNGLVESITIPNTLTWSTDVSFSDTPTYTLLYGNYNVADNFRRNCFYANNNETVFTLINYAPLMVMNNQIGMPLYSVQWNGFLKTPQIAYESSLIAPIRNSYLINNETTLCDLAKHSTLKL